MIYLRVIGPKVACLEVTTGHGAKRALTKLAEGLREYNNMPILGVV